MCHVAFVGWAVYNLALSSKGAAANFLEAVKEGWLGFRGWVAAFRRESRGAASVGVSSRGIEITSFREPMTPETGPPAQV